ncbi:hypothetical protein [Scytonema sp. PCC 10023]
MTHPSNPATPPYSNLTAGSVKVQLGSLQAGMGLRTALRFGF